MNTSNTSKNIKIAVIFLVALLAGFAGYARFFASIEENVSPDGAWPDNVPDMPATSTDLSVIEPIQKPDAMKKIPVTNTRQPVASIPLPDLDRITFNSELSPERKQEYTGRMKDAAKQIRANESVYENLLELASYRKLIGDYVGAEEVWMYMTKIYPNARQPYEALGNLYHFYTKEFLKAESAMKKAIENEPVYPYSYVNLFELYTLSYTEKKNMAEQTLLNGLANNPKSVLIELTLAKYYDALGRKNDARTYYEQSLEFARSVSDKSLEMQIVAALEKL